MRLHSWVTCAIAGAALAAGCTIEEGDQGPVGPSGPAGTAAVTPDSGDRYFTSPGVNLVITGVSGGASVGSSLTITFTLTKDDGTAWDMAEMDTGLALVSGPTVNYQRVLPRVDDVRSRAVALGNGAYEYTFASAMPATYAAPYNDTTAFGSGEGELAGQSLLAGTYTVYLNVGWDYTADGESFRDVGEGFADFLFGGAATLQSREVVTNANCNACHQDLRAHGDNRRDVRSCVLCHTAGAEDRNVASVAGGTPGASIDFRVMVHRIHAGANLPSVLGVSTNTGGARNYAATPQPYQLVGFGNAVHDFSAVRFPRWPSMSMPMPRDQGYSSLTTAQKALEDGMRSGPVDCNACHAGAAQASLAYAQPTRRSCGSCHDDVVWSTSYTANGQTMAAQSNDSNCVTCHPSSGATLAVIDAHRHPWSDPAVNAGLVTTLSAVAEAGSNDGDGTFDAGEKLAVTVSFADASGNALAASTLDQLTAIVAGPDGNRQVLLNTGIPLAALTGSGPYTFNLPQAVVFEFLGDATATSNETFTTSRAPIWTVTGITTTVYERTATAGGTTTTTAAAPAAQRWVDVVGTASFAKGDRVVVEDGVTGREEYLEIGLVEATRLWFTQPLRVAHASGVSVDEVTLSTRTAGTHYTLTGASGTVTEIGSAFGTGNAIVISYTSDFVVPSTFPPPLNDGPDLDETWGSMAGKSLVDGTYVVGVYARQTITVSAFSETNTYRNPSPAATRRVLFGSASNLTPYTAIDSAQTCNACHGTVLLHGSSRRDLDTCLLCHAGGGTGDRPRWVAANAPATNGTTIDFRTMLHKIHRGKHLPDAATYAVVAFGSSAWPNNYATATFEKIGFPAMPGEGVQNCVTCHGPNGTAWYTPSNRDHPSQQSLPVRNWRAVCTSCHSASSTQAHADLMTSTSGAESCATCHGAGRSQDVATAHRSR